MCLNILGETYICHSSPLQSQGQLQLSRFYRLGCSLVSWGIQWEHRNISLCMWLSLFFSLSVSQFIEDIQSVLLDNQLLKHSLTSVWHMNEDITVNEDSEPGSRCYLSCIILFRLTHSGSKDFPMDPSPPNVLYCLFPVTHHNQQQHLILEFPPMWNASSMSSRTMPGTYLLLGIL